MELFLLSFSAVPFVVHKSIFPGFVLFLLNPS